MMRMVMKRLRRDDGALGLSELLISMFLTLGIMAMVGTMFIQTTRITSASNQTGQLTQSASNVANEVSSTIRMATTLAQSNQAPATAIISGNRSSVQLYSYANTTPQNSAPSKYTITLSNTGVVTESRCVGTASNGYWTFGSCTSTVNRTLATGVLNATTGNAFLTYNDVNGDPIVIGDQNLGDTQRAGVASITIEVSTRAKTATVAPIVIKNTVVLRNLGLDPIS